MTSSSPEVGACSPRRIPASPPLLLIVALSVGACASSAPDTPQRIVRPGAPGEESRVDTAATVGEPRGHTGADVRFMHDMVVHHLQALEMTALLPGRTENADLLLLARRIDLSQRDEIAIARRWLEDRDEPAPGVNPGEGTAHAEVHGESHGAAEGAAQGAAQAARHGMPGMLSPVQLDYLSAARGRDFDVLFLAAMLQHHEGALVMVADLFASPGAAQEDEVFQFASHVEADQRIEMARMQRMLHALLPADR